ncbi:bifunctional glycosyltransferase family 2/GtrA family protein [Streptomyces sp. NPDC005438]|uniref:bifunctional glycosyltransferase family 2/GtrA family protein n=1 Tax=Streptomyces sp. NPDC005438 TaxID=3156880 RepID=UPI0033A698E5
MRSEPLTTTVAEPDLRPPAPDGTAPFTGRSPEETLPARKPLSVPADGPLLEVVVPVYNEEAALEHSVLRLCAYLEETFPYAYRVVIADNASTDDTPRIARRLAREREPVHSVRLDRKGRGYALRTVWADSSAPVRAYMDVDLSTDLNALLPLVAPLVSGHSDLAIGSRLAGGSRVVRGPKRELISRGYNLLLKGFLSARFSDAQCGFKAIRGDVADRLLPLVKDSGWFFDTELLVLAERAGLRVHEVPVDWVDDPDSKVALWHTAVEDLRGVWRVGRALASGALPMGRLRRPFGDDPRDRALSRVPHGLARQVLSFCAIGVVSTLLYLSLYALIRPHAGAQVSNACALVLSTLANTAANRRLTFRVRGRTGAVRHQAQGLAIFAFGLALTSGSLLALHLAVPEAARGTELMVLVAANLAATLLRFLLFRLWVFASDTPSPRPPTPAAPPKSPATTPTTPSRERTPR